MTYSLLEDEDWQEFERRRQEAETLGALLDDAPSGIAPLPSRPAPNFGSVELAPLAEDPTAPDWTTGVSIGASALAALADLALNKGRGTGQILAAGAAGADRSADIRLRGRQEAMQYEQARARQAMEQQQLAERARYNDYLERAMGARVGNQSELNADRDASRALRERTVEQGDKRIDQADTRLKQGDRRLDQVEDLELAQNKSAATTRGRIGTELAMADDTSDAAAVRAQKVQAATQEGAIERIEAGHKARSAAERESAGNRQIGNADVVDEGVWKSLGTKQINDANDLARTRATFLQAMNDMAEIQARNGMQALPSGDKAAFDTAQAAAIGSLTTLFQTGVINEAEYKRYRERIPASGVNATAVYGAVSQGLGGPNVVGDQITGTRDELEKVYQRGLSQYGIRGRPIGSATGHDRLPVTNQRPSQVPKVGDAIRLGPTGPGAPSSVNALPRATPNPDGTFTLPGGKRPYTADEVQRLITMGRLAPL